MIIDCHAHCSVHGRPWPSTDEVMESLELYEIDKICVSYPITSGSPTAKRVRKCNNEILTSMRRHSQHIMGQCFVNPGYARETQDEITRCVVDGGMIGIKLYHQYRIDEPVQFPVIERSIDLGVPILMHAGYLTDPETLSREPRISTAEHFLDVARRYPEAMLICAHIGGGGDWERQLKALREAPTVHLDTSGSVIDAGMIERCVRDLGARRLLFACDGNVARGLGKILDANITERQRRMIFAGNFQELLSRRKR